MAYRITYNPPECSMRWFSRQHSAMLNAIETASLSIGLDESVIGLTFSTREQVEDVLFQLEDVLEANRVKNVVLKVKTIDV